MRRTGAVALIVTACAGLVALLAVAASDKRELAFTLGVVPTTVAAELAPGAQACQTPIAVPEEFARVRLQVGTYRRAGQPLEVTVRSAGSKRVLGRGRLPGGYADVTEQTASVGEVRAGQRISVCVRNAGTRRIALYGNSDVAVQPSRATVQGREPGTDLTLVFLSEQPRSMLSRLPEVFEHASLFRPGWVGPWLFWLLTAATLVGVPLLLARALADSADAP